MSIALLLCAVAMRPTAPVITKISPSEVWVEMGGSTPEKNPNAVSFSVFGRGLRRGEVCRLGETELPARRRSSHRLEVRAPVAQLLKFTGQADGHVPITAWDPKTKQASNRLELSVRFRAIGG